MKYFQSSSRPPPSEHVHLVFQLSMEILCSRHEALSSSDKAGLYLILQLCGLSPRLHMMSSQNHRIVVFGRDLWTSSGPIPLLKQGHLEPVARDHVQVAFEYLQGWRLHSLSLQPVPVLGHPHMDKVFPDVQREPPVFQFLPMASGPVTGHH